MVRKRFVTNVLRGKASSGQLAASSAVLASIGTGPAGFGQMLYARVARCRQVAHRQLAYPTSSRITTCGVRVRNANAIENFLHHLLVFRLTSFATSANKEPYA